MSRNSHRPGDAYGLLGLCLLACLLLSIGCAQPTVARQSYRAARLSLQQAESAYQAAYRALPASEMPEVDEAYLDWQAAQRAYMTATKRLITALHALRALDPTSEDYDGPADHLGTPRTDSR